VVVVAAPADSTVLARTPGSVYVQFMSGSGSARIRFRGNVLGSIRRGRIIATANVTVGGWKTKRKLANGTVAYRGPDNDHRLMTFHPPSPPAAWRVRLRGMGINASGFVRGCMTLNAFDHGRTGHYRIGTNGAARPWPRTARTTSLGSGC
jgi:hypothetical protein